MDDSSWAVLILILSTSSLSTIVSSCGSHSVSTSGYKGNFISYLLDNCNNGHHLVLGETALSTAVKKNVYNSVCNLDG